VAFGRQFVAKNAQVLPIVCICAILTSIVLSLLLQSPEFLIGATMPSPSQSQIDVIAHLEAAIRFQDGAQVEQALIQAFAAGLHAQMSPLLIVLAEAPWHMHHEALVSAIQQLRIPEAVEALEHVAHATYAYLGYDESYGLARKCTWALADIGTPAAYQALVRLARSANPSIASYATKRITNWQDERHRKPI
jgi:hypothetical protein